MTFFAYFCGLFLTIVISEMLQIYVMKNTRLDAEQRLKSIYNPKVKSKPHSFFPKIHRIEHSPQSQSKPMIKSLNKKYRNQNIFKQQEDNEKIVFKPHALDDEKIMGSKEYQELEQKIQECRKRHSEEMSNLQNSCEGVHKKIAKSKKESYEVKLSLWELKNEVMDLETALQEQEELYNQLCYDLGYEEADEYEDDGEQQDAPEHRQQMGQHQQQPNIGPGQEQGRNLASTMPHPHIDCDVGNDGLSYRKMPTGEFQQSTSNPNRINTDNR